MRGPRTNKQSNEKETKMIETLFKALMLSLLLKISNEGLNNHFIGEDTYQNEGWVKIK